MLGEFCGLEAAIAQAQHKRLRYASPTRRSDVPLCVKNNVIRKVALKGHKRR
jgi:hypothetical protein